jgi:Domain of unknown function (DUF4271)
MATQINYAQEAATKNVDLRNEWLVYRDGKFLGFTNESTNSIFFWIDGRQEKGNFLLLETKHPFSLFINARLIWSGENSMKFSIDSLAHQYGSKLWLSVHSTSGFQTLQTLILTDKPIEDIPQNSFRKGYFFLDFVLIASLLLIIAFTLFIRTNPMLTQDYFDFRKLLTVQDRAESNFGLRIASSVNILFYFFGSCLLSLILLIVFHVIEGQLALSAIFKIKSTAQGLWQWTLLSVCIFGVLVFKLLWVSLFASIFGFKDTVRFQFFSFVRLIFISVAAIALFGLAYYLLNVRQSLFYYYQIYLLLFMLMVGTVVVYFKLMARLPFHFFHLFSYLCASEIIPLIILMKMILY